LATAALAALTVALASLSDDGLKLPDLAASSAFIGLLFFIIAAPAIAFQPAPKMIEFLAKHGDYAGLWLLGPALVAGLAMPNIKLQALLASAMAIELLWFLRLRRADRRRRLYVLDDRDLSVLESQAKGDLKSFRRHHGISELALSKDGVGWKGCAKQTPPCPFNLYVNRLGLNTAPCCREHMKEISYFVADSLRQIGAVHWLEGGSLLGAVREGGRLLDWEDDVDISVLLDADMTWARLTKGLSEHCARAGYYIDFFEDKDYVTISFDRPEIWPFRWQRNRLRGEIRTDIAIFRKVLSHGVEMLERRTHKGAMPITESGGYGVPPEVVLPTSTIPFVGRDFACPNQSDAYLRILYGDFRKIELTYVDAAAAETRAEIDAVKRSPAN
jgi:hypothetical protein